MKEISVFSTMFFFICYLKYLFERSLCFFCQGLKRVCWYTCFYNNVMVSKCDILRLDREGTKDILLLWCVIVVYTMWMMLYFDTYSLGYIIPFNFYTHVWFHLFCFSVKRIRKLPRKHYSQVDAQQYAYHEE